MTYTLGGSYTATSLNVAGCVHTTTLNLTINNSTMNGNATVTACNLYTWNGSTYTSSGTYTFTSMNAAACVNTATLTLTINYSTSSVQNITAANSYTWAANNVTYTTSGTYTHTLVGGNAAGCDSNLTLNLSILTILVVVDQDVSCFGNNDGSALASASGGSGNFTYDIDGQNIFTNTTGSFIGLTPGIHTICAMESPSNVVVCGTVNIAEPAPLTVVLTVDSTVSCLGNDGGLTATISGGTAIIQPYLTTWSPGVTTLTPYDLSVTGLSTGTYTVTVEDDHVCMATATITLGATPALMVSATNTAILCYGGTSVITPSTSGGTGTVTTSITGGTYTVIAGTYTITATDTKGCTATTVVTITQPVEYVYSQTAASCDSYQWTVNSQTYTTSGTYTASYNSVNGCDSVYTLNLTINYSSSSVQNVTVANSYTWAANGVTYTVSGTYTHTFAGGNAAGCDSNLTLILNILNITAQVDQNISCNGNNDGSLISSATGGTGNFTYDIDGANVFTNTTGTFIGLAPGVHTVCAMESPSNVVVCTTVTITQPDPISIVLTVDSTVSCLGNDGGISAVVTGGTTILQPYLTTWANGVTTNTLYDLSVTGLSAGTYTLTVEDDNLCFASASITVGTTTPVVVTASNTTIACFGGTSVITTSALGGSGAITTSVSGGSNTVTAGTYTITATDAKGCTGTTVITISEPAQITGSSSATACDSYTWNGNTYTISGAYSQTFMASNGCDSVHTLNLTINNSTSSTETASACNSYTWAANGMTYTASGNYTHTSLNVAGCLHTTTLNLTINTSTTSNTSITACDSYTWSVNGMTYTSSGIYTATELNSFGCINTATLDLTINYSTTNGGSTTSQCGSYTWNGTTYTATGVYTFTTINAAGCVNTATLNLTINQATSSTTTISACNSYTWTNGVTYTAAGTYSYTTTNVAGCDSALTLILTLVNGVSVSPKALLSGAYMGGGMMHDSLRSRGVLPTSEPFTILNFTPIGCPGYTGGETTSSAMFTITGNDAIVDWVHVEIRNTDVSYSKIATQNALLQRDGDIVDVNGNPLTFNCVCPGNYYVTVKHRNHIGVMTATSLALTATTQLVDFTTAAPVWTKPGLTNAARETNGAYRLLWPGDTKTDKNVKYNGANNDKEPILYAVGIATPNNILEPVYRTEDANMDGRVKYNNNDNDKNFILNKIISSNAPISTPNDILSQHTPN